ncbi:MAG: hypothetical protein V1774_03865, partial [Candidatus Eisenbacteria bacterium]
MNGQPKPPAGRRRNARGIAPALLFPASLALVLLSSSQAFAQGTLAEIEDIWQKGLYEESFSLRRDA